MLGEGKPVEEMYTRHEPGKAPVVYRANKPKLPNILVPTTPTTGADRGGAVGTGRDGAGGFVGGRY